MFHRRSSISCGLFFLVSLKILAACNRAATNLPVLPPTSSPETSPSRLGAGFRYSTYGAGTNGAGTNFDPQYWASVGQRMAERFPGSSPAAIWIVGNVTDQGVQLTFPGESVDSLIRFSAEDHNETALALFDRLGFQVWLQVEPGNAPMETLIPLVLERYQQHPCVAGLGLDVEWYRSYTLPEGQAIGDGEARAWLTAIQAINPRYRLFLKHWEAAMMPATVREGILFVDDSQQFASLDAMAAEFAAWGNYFAPAPVAFQYGYEDDRTWWGKLGDAPLEIGRRILAAVPNTEALFWVDFTAQEVFPKE